MRNSLLLSAIFVSLSFFTSDGFAENPYVPLNSVLFLDTAGSDDGKGYKPTVLQPRPLGLPGDSAADTFVDNFPVQQIIDSPDLLGMSCDSDLSTVATYFMNPNPELASALDLSEHQDFDEDTDFVVSFKSKIVNINEVDLSEDNVSMDSGWPLNSSGHLTVQDFQKLQLENQFSNVTEDECFELYEEATRRRLDWGEEKQKMRYCDIAKGAPYLYSNIYRAGQFQKLGTQFNVQFNRSRDCEFDGLGSINCSRASSTPIKLGDLEVYGVMVFASQETFRTPQSTSGHYWVDLQFKVSTGSQGYHWYNMNFRYDTYEKQEGREAQLVPHCEFRASL